MAPCGEKLELTEKLALTFLRLHHLLLAEKQALSDLDRKRIDELEAEIQQVMEDKTVLLNRWRSDLKDQG